MGLNLSSEERIALEAEALGYARGWLDRDTGIGGLGNSDTAEAFAHQYIAHAVDTGRLDVIYVAWQRFLTTGSVRPVPQTLSNVSALDAIASVLDGKEWDSETLDRVAELLRRAGYEIRDNQTLSVDALPVVRKPATRYRMGQPHDIGWGMS
jgi:hypothetical protein